MLVEDIMKTDVVTLPQNASIQEALSLLEENRIRHIPIVNDAKEVIGIVSDRDVRDACPSSLTKGMKIPNKAIKTIMSTPVITILPLDFVEDISKIFYDNEIGCLPVISNNQLIGIVTEKDMLYTLVQLTGTHVRSSLIEVKVPDIPGILPKVTAVFGNHHVNIVSVLVYPFQNNPNYKVLVFRINTMNPQPIIDDLRDSGYQLMWPNNFQGPKV